MKTSLAVGMLLAGVCLAQDARPLYQSPHYSMLPDRVIEGTHSARAITRTAMESNYGAAGAPARAWKLETDIARYPQLRSEYPLVDALYNMALEEMRKDIRPDGAFMAGAEWDGVWTRDISYSIVLALAAVEPETAKISLLRKVNRGRIMQDTGTGGSWPVSSDRMVWALAAWEVYQATGDRAWLKQSFEVIRNSAGDDAQVVLSHGGGVLGESSFLDWREQTYPRWMSPVDIYSSQALGTNAVHYRMYRILASMARLLGQPSKQYEQAAARIRTMMNERLWIEGRGYYGQYLYGRDYPGISPRAEALGEALTILFDIAGAGRQDRILSSVPVTEYGIPCIYPQTPGIPPYHNNAVWPFVQAFWNLAAAKRHNDDALMQGLTAMYRASALFLTNKENLVAATGADTGTEINSGRQLWSVAGNLAMVYRVFFGMEFAEEGIRLHPVIPAELGGVKTLENFRYRNAVLSLRLEGHGASVRSVTLDGKPWRALIPSDLVGSHMVKIRMSDEPFPAGRVNLRPVVFAPDMPLPARDGNTLKWAPVEGAVEYRVYRNVERFAATGEPAFAMAGDKHLSEYQVSAVDANGLESFLSEPVAVGGEPITIEAEEYEPRAQEQLTGFTGKGFVELDRNVNPKITLRSPVPASGRYEVSFRYSNGSGPVNTENKCAIRTLLVDGKTVGAIVMPQRGSNQWSDWGMSSRQIVSLRRGVHTFQLRFEAADENMNPAVNRAMLDSMRLVRID